MGHFKGLAVGAMIAGLGVLATTNGCSAASSLASAQSALCCKDFKPGTDMLSGSFTGDASTNAQFAVFAQAVGDLSTVAEGAVADVTAACQGIATDMGDMNSPSGKEGTDLMNFWCAEAVAQIKATLSASAGATLNIAFEPPQCSASVSVNADCQAHCNVNGSCDVKANPPTCMGGTLEVSCMGSCMASAGASIDCTGSCSGMCSGSCQASGGVSVDCQGKCDGTCAAKAGVGNGMGAQADGTCQGSCNGKCTYSASAPMAMCTGTCSGKCSASCSAMGGVAAQCSGTCSAMGQPLSCKGGTLSGGCKVDANCSANCNASASAKADCSPPQLTITVSGNANAQLNTLINTLEANLGQLIVVVKARGMAFANLISTVSASGSATFSGGLDAQGAACLIPIAAAISQAAQDFPASIQASVSVMGSLSIM
jgi:hypothetical protein